MFRFEVIQDLKPNIDMETWNATRKVLERNKHSNYGEHIHLFTGIVRCPTCGKFLSSTNSFKYSGTPKEKVYYHLTCKNPNCKSQESHQNFYKNDKSTVKFDFFVSFILKKEGFC